MSDEKEEELKDEVDASRSTPEERKDAPQQPHPNHRHTHPRTNNNKLTEIYQSMPIPADRVGWIIGKQGAYIHNLEKWSGCSISVSDSPSREFNHEWNYVQLQGTTRSVDKAKKLIYLRLMSFPGPRSDAQHSPRRREGQSESKPQQNSSGSD
mmetsp:Transcript_9191/g.23592  ORF Transcript_9191/g.23592 Transcript_9191/m.23592 type:complete len:153 (+) Transcript_9191:127-585(+)